MARPKSEDKRKAILDAATAYLRSAVVPLTQRRRYRNRLASPGVLCLRTSARKMIWSMPLTGRSS